MALVFIPVSLATIFANVLAQPDNCLCPNASTFLSSLSPSSQTNLSSLVFTPSETAMTMLAFFFARLFTFLINCWLDTINNAIWIGIKLIIVCNITVIYSKTTSINGIAVTISKLLKPLKIFGIKEEEVKIMVSISLAMLPTLKRNIMELKEACKSKGITINLKNIKYIITSAFLSAIKRVDQIEEALIAKGYKN